MDDNFQGILEAHSVCEVPMIMEAQCLEEIESTAQVMIFGSPEPPLVSVHPVNGRIFHSFFDANKCYF